MLSLAFRHPNQDNKSPKKQYIKHRAAQGEEVLKKVPQQNQAAQSSIWDLQPGEFLDLFPSTPKSNQSNMFS